MYSHPNKKLQALWTEYREAGFTLDLLEELWYDDPHEDHSRELKTLRQKRLDANLGAEKLWR